MDYNQLVIDLQNINVRPPDIRRAALYYDYLLAARQYFHVTLNQARPVGVGVATYAFVTPALQNVNLLNSLAKILDYYVAAAVQGALLFEYANGHGPNDPQPWTYADYFDNRVLSANQVTYDQRVQQFRADFPLAAHAINRLAQNFMSNIKRCCERLHDDIPTLLLFYQDLYPNGLAFNRLLRIKSSGSDFHKGGGQVLILTLGILQNAQQGELKVVYKPGDLEADCLLTGDTQAVNRALQINFMQASLVEIYNTQANLNPNIHALPLRTYRILPIAYNSAHGGNAPLPVPDAYGYIEYLNNDLVWGTTEWFGFYPYAESDFVIFTMQNRPQIIRDFYYRAGAYCAIFTAFSVIDIHVENFRVRKYDPYPIDLEISLTTAVNDIGTTILINDNFGALNQETSLGEVWNIENINVPGRSKLVRDAVNEPCANRLYDAQSGQQKTLIDVSAGSLFVGYNRAMQVLRAAQAAGAFNAWFTRLENNVVVRHLTYGTGVFQGVVRQIYIEKLQNGRGRNVQTQAAIDEVMLQQRTMRFEDWTQHGGLPDFLSFLNAEAAVDILALDIPVYYFRIEPNNLDLYNSRGQIVTIPNTIQVLQQNNPVNVPCQPAVGRFTFFNTQPTINTVRAPQVTALGQPITYQQRYDLIEQTMLQRLHLNAVPDEPEIIIPFDI